MPHSFIVCRMHCIFSTRERQPLITPEMAARLHPYLAGIARQNKIIPHAVGGTEDHVHLLVDLPSTMAVAKALQLIKGGSSKWIHQQFPQTQRFAWQEGYGAFSIGISLTGKTIRYIQTQSEHHRVKTFKEEFLDFLRRYEMEYDERYIWD